ncbi:MAG: cupin domain-containing protein [bacterium]
MNTTSVFPGFVTALPLADIPIDGLTAHLAQGEKFQLVFMSFEKETHVPEHTHAEQLELVLEGTVDLTVNRMTTTYKKGDRFYIPAGIPHSAVVHAGFSSMAFFNQADRYRTK